MDLVPTDIQSDLREAAAGFLARTLPAGRAAELLDGPGWDPGVWRQVAELGWLGIAVPEQLGGAGLGLVEEAIVVEEAAYALLPAPLISTLGMATPLLSAAADAEDLLGDIVAGETPATLAWAEDGLSAELSSLGVPASARAVSAGSDWRISGVKRWVPDASRCGLLLVTACTDSGEAGVFAVRAQADGVRVLARDTIDPVRPFGDIELDRAEARSVLLGDEVAPALERVRLRTTILACAAAVGLCRQLHARSSEYAAQREQFGRVIGTYQAVSHRVADQYVALELARSLLLWATLRTADDDPRMAAAVSAAASYVLPVAIEVAEAAIQVHGGIGTTWESPLHWSYKHALALAATAGSPAAHRRRIVEAVKDEVFSGGGTPPDRPGPESRSHAIGRRA
jgi:alkylation response protein AidB-like acyl-CoA dehydrogenase